MQIQLSWIDPVMQSLRQPVLETPVALGREFALMPGVIDGQRVSRIVLGDDRVEPYHALLTEQQGELLITDQGSRLGTKVNGVVLPGSTVLDGDQIQIGPFQIQIKLLNGISGAQQTARFPETPAANSTPAFGTSVPSRTPVSGSERCDRMVGFLFKRRCDRTNRTNCPYCRGGELNTDPYFYDYSYYPGFGRYTHGHWGSSYYHHRDSYFYNPETGCVDFTEADNAAFAQEGDVDYEQDFGAS